MGKTCKKPTPRRVSGATQVSNDNHIELVTVEPNTGGSDQPRSNVKLKPEKGKVPDGVCLVRKQVDQENKENLLCLNLEPRGRKQQKNSQVGET